MGSFAEFLSTFDSDINRRGKQFERFVKWFLKSDPEWSTQVDEVWLWDEYPDRWGPDCGIDLVVKSKAGKTWAVQAKCYSADYDISKNDVDTFLSESNRKHIDHRLLIATTDRIGANARQVLDAQEKLVVRYLLSHFESAAVDFPDSIHSLSSGKRKPQPELDRPHQIEAVDAVLSGFQNASRGQLIMACGTGKTFVCLWVKERLKAKRTLVLVPSLNLLSQMLNEWTFAAREQFDALCVCSDQTVGRRDEDEAISQVSDIPFPVSSDVNEIAEFLNGDRDRVVFSTYQSSPLVAEAQKHPNVPRFDLVIADEAHRCAGKSDTIFGTVLNDQLIKADRRLFATATPRVYRTSLKKAAEEFGVEVVDMSDEKSFGKQFHTLTFGEAIKREQLTDYRVLIIVVDDERINEWIENRRLVATDTGLATDARSLAGQIGLLKAIKDWNLRRLISFHSRVKGARVFSEDIVQVGEWLDAAHRPLGHLRAEYVSGEMPAILRKQKLTRLRNVGKGDICLLANAKCLSEGVDVPALDGVAFIDPRSSEIDIIQSVGRAIRLSENKTMGTIVIPVFIEQTENAEEALEASEFKPIWDVLEALKSHDERLSNELDELRIELGAKRKRSVGTSDLTKIVFDLPTSVNENFAQSLRARLVEKTTESWMFWFGLLEAFVDEHGHSRVASSYRTPGSHRLGLWIGTQRTLRDQMAPDRRERLEALKGWSWDPLTDLWEEGFARLKEFADREGHSRVRPEFRTDDGYPLGAWVQTQIQRKNVKNRPDRQERLEALPGWSWSLRNDLWEESFAQLKLFSDRYGHCRVPESYKTDEGYPLGKWVRGLRLKASRAVNSHGAIKGIGHDRKSRLEALPGWSWGVRDEKWEEFFANLLKFADREGHCKVPLSFKTDDGLPLGSWVSKQRAQFRRGKMEPNRDKRLEAVPGWVWGRPNQLKASERRDAAWEAAFVLLSKFVEQEGHCRVPGSLKTESGFNLGIWVWGQRQKKADGAFNHPDRQQRLEALPGWSWAHPRANQDQARWENGFANLRHFLEEHDHSEIPQKYRTEEGFQLGEWVAWVRRNTVDPDRRRRLEALPQWSWKRGRQNALWEKSFAELKQYSVREGHCKVPPFYRTKDGFGLAQWVAAQKVKLKKRKMDPDRRQRLEALPGWVWKSEKISPNQDDRETMGGP